jgi:hypothetical protein
MFHFSRKEAVEKSPLPSIKRDSPSWHELVYGGLYHMKLKIWISSWAMGQPDIIYHRNLFIYVQW